jgi:hypothetical protein
MPLAELTAPSSAAPADAFAEIVWTPEMLESLLFAKAMAERMAERPEQAERDRRLTSRRTMRRIMAWSGEPYAYLDWAAAQTRAVRPHATHRAPRRRSRPRARARARAPGRQDDPEPEPLALRDLGGAA